MDPNQDENEEEMSEKKEATEQRKEEAERSDDETPKYDNKQSNKAEENNDDNKPTEYLILNHLDNLKIDENYSGVADKSNSDNQSNDNLNENKKESINKKEDECDESYDDDEDECGANERQFKSLNNFRLEAMKNSTSLLNKSQEDDLSGGTSLQRCLEKFTAIELINEKLSCDTCTSKLNKISKRTPLSKSNSTKSTKPPPVATSVLKQYLICDLPAVLTIHLKRFQQHGMRLEKCNKHVNFPLILDMSPYTSQMCVNIFKSQSDDSSSAKYSLYGLVEHSGRLNSGHYTAYVKINSRASNSSMSIYESLFLGRHRLCHLNSMLKRWNGSSISIKKMQEEMLNYEESMKDSNIHTDYLEMENSSLIDLTSSESTSINELAAQDHRWFYVSDSSVNEVSQAKVLKAQAYLLFYERVQ